MYLFPLLLSLCMADSSMAAGRSPLGIFIIYAVRSLLVFLTMYCRNVVLIVLLGFFHLFV